MPGSPGRLHLSHILTSRNQRDHRPREWLLIPDRNTNHKDEEWTLEKENYKFFRKKNIRWKISHHQNYSSIAALNSSRPCKRMDHGHFQVYPRINSMEIVSPRKLPQSQQLPCIMSSNVIMLIVLLL